MSRVSFSADTIRKEDELLAAAAAASGSTHQHHENHTGPAADVPPTISSMCPNCGSSDIEQREASGDSVCTVCGTIVEENAIVSAVEFVEGAGGSSNMVGQFVSGTSSKAYTGPPSAGGGGGRYGFSRDSRETTLANGRRRIQEVASRLRLGTNYIDAAHRLFTIAVEKNFVQGRRTTHVVAACLFIACRQEKSQHMLIDFSDALQVNVYSLGTCFLKFRRLLGLKLEIIDPALYIYRFAAHLELNEKANAVAMTALRLVSRMKRDWIVAGRRPAGICAAALLIASRAHGFGKNQQDVTRILRVCGLTVSNRVKEFEQTPSAQLTLDQFTNVDLETEMDPPAFSRNKLQEARVKAIQDGNVELLESGALDEKPLGKHASRWRGGKKRKSATRDQMNQVYSTIEKELVTENDDGSAEINTSLVLAESTVLPPELDDKWKTAYPRKRDGRIVTLPQDATEEEVQAPVAPTEAKISLNEWSESIPEDMEDELEGIFRSEEEEKQKEAIFNKINKDYLVHLQRKETERLNLEAAAKDQEKVDAAQAEGHARYKSSRQSRQKQPRTHNQAARRESLGGTVSGSTTLTTEEQLMAAVSSRKISRKINYDALSSLFDEDGSFATATAQDDNGQTEE